MRTPLYSNSTITRKYIMMDNNFPKKWNGKQWNQNKTQENNQVQIFYGVVTNSAR